MEQINESRALFCLQNRTDRLGCHLEIPLDEIYRRPRLPFSEKEAKLHDLLRPLKTAYNWLASVLSEMPGVDLELYRYICDLYNIETEHPEFWEDEKFQGDNWFAVEDPLPVQISALMMRTWDSQYFACSLDLAPLRIFGQKPALAPFPDDFDHSILKICALAAKSYNRCVLDIYDLGFSFFPAKFVDALAHLYPAIPLQGNRLPAVL